MHLKKIIACLFLGVFLSSCLNWSNDWSQNYGDSANTSFSPKAGPAEIENLKWTFNPDGSIITNPVISDGIIYVGDQKNIIYAIDENSGNIIWKYDGKADLRSVANLAISNGILFCGYDDELVAIDAKTGQIKWKTEISGSISASIMTYNNLVVVGSYSDFISAFNTTSGKLEWEIDAEGTYFQNKPAIKEDVLYYASHQNFVRAIDLKSQSVAWKTENFRTNTSPSVGESSVYFAFNLTGSVYAVDRETGREKWRAQLADMLAISTPSIGQENIFVSGRDGFLYSINKNTGQLAWKFNTGSSISTSPIITKNTVYVGNSDGKFVAIEIETGEEIWSFETNGAIQNNPSMANGTIYIPSDFLYAIE